eukprot:1528839-Pleurochrysis_carterae.AAC.1
MIAQAIASRVAIAAASTATEQSSNQLSPDNSPNLPSNNATSRITVADRSEDALTSTRAGEMDTT